MNLYSVYDRKAGKYGKPSLMINDNVAIRDYKFALSQSINLSIIDDCELYCLGTFDDDSGVIIAYKKPKYVSNFLEGDLNEK